MTIVKTSRLTIRHLQADDADFILNLVNQPAWLEHIGDKNVHSLDEAKNYIQNGPVAMYREHGLGLLLVENNSSGQAIGICGLIKRETLASPDIGVAFLSEHWRKGYAYEAASAVIVDVHKRLNIDEILAITTQHNHASISLLVKLGFEFQEKMQDNNKELNIYSCQCERLSIT